MIIVYWLEGQYSHKWLEEFEDTKGVIRIRKSKDRQNNGQKCEDTRKSKTDKTMA